MQQDLDAAYPLLDIKIAGVNELGQAVGNDTITALGDIPWLQDVDRNGNSISDVWYDSWNITYRDVVVLDADNVPFGTVNLTQHSLSVPENYAALRQMFLDASLQDPGLAWQNPASHADVDNNGEVVPLDALLLINTLNKVGPQPLPYRGSGGQPPARYYDCSGDGQLTPLDALVAINDINRQTATLSRTGRTAETVPPNAAGAAMTVSPVPRSVADAVNVTIKDTPLNHRAVDAAFSDAKFDLLPPQSTGNPAIGPLDDARPEETSRPSVPSRHDLPVAAATADWQDDVDGDTLSGRLRASPRSPWRD